MASTVAPSVPVDPVPSLSAPSDPAAPVPAAPVRPRVRRLVVFTGKLA
jgi:hypothetical protein